MICPKCGSEYRPGFFQCADCGIALVSSVNDSLSPMNFVPSSPEAENEDLDLVTVFKSGDPLLVAMARSLLESAGIPFAASGESMQDLFGKYSPIVSPVEFQVNREDSKDAALLLKDLEETSNEAPRPEDEDD